jgi:hypothetical protein
VAAPVGAEVRAPAAGVVTLAEPDLFYSGGTVIIDHGLGLFTLADIRLRAGNADRPCRYSQPRRRMSWGRDRRIDDPQVGETGKETHHEHAVDAAGMPRGLESDRNWQSIDLSEIRAVGSAVSHWNTHQCPRDFATIVHDGGRTFSRVGRQKVAQPGVIGAQRIEVHSDGPIRGDDVADTVNPRRFDNRSKADGSSVDLFVDPILELRDDDGISGLDEPE